MRILPIGLNVLMDKIKLRMVDPNKAVLKSYLLLTGLVVKALGIDAKQFAKKMLPPVLQNLSDKATMVMQDTVLVMNIWSEQVNPEMVINYLAPLLIQENPEFRTEALTWIIKNRDSIKNTELKNLLKPLVSCMCDKSLAIRTWAEQIVGDVMLLTGSKVFSLELIDVKPAVKSTLKLMLENVKEKVGASLTLEDANSGDIGIV